MNAYCKTCPDRGGEECLLPSRASRILDASKRTGFEVLDGLITIGIFMNSKGHDQPNGRPLEETFVQLDAKEATIDSCIEAHQLAVESDNLPPAA